jgi:excisionase family DNA binding protein
MPVSEVARLLGVSRYAIYQAVERRELESVRLGSRVLVLRSSVDKLLASGSNGVDHQQRALSAGVT